MSSGRQTQAGFTYLAALLCVTVIGFALAAASELWSHARQREKETELIWIGEQFRQAIGLYYQRSPGTVKRYPAKLEDLLLDRRYLTNQRYLRKIYADPITGNSEWGIVPAPEGGVMGVYSRSAAMPVKSANGNRYADWQFTYEPPAPTAGGK